MRPLITQIPKPDKGNIKKEIYRGGGRQKWVWLQQGNREDPCDDRMVLFFVDSINVNILWLHYTTATAKKTTVWKN